MTHLTPHAWKLLFGGICFGAAIVMIVECVRRFLADLRAEDARVEALRSRPHIAATDLPDDLWADYADAEVRAARVESVDVEWWLRQRGEQG